MIWFLSQPEVRAQARPLRALLPARARPSGV